jgi:Salmonella virulence plasmid 65kDa B protein
MFSGVEDLVPFLSEGIGNWDKIEKQEGGYLVKKYRPRIEGSFAKIEKITHKSHGVYWKVSTRDNVTTVFGRSKECRVADPEDDSRIFKRLPEFSFDGKGNWNSYEYKKDSNSVTYSMVAFEDKILSFQQENEEAQRVIVKGSDDHLDILLQIKDRIDPLTEKYAVLLNDVIPSTNSFNQEQVEKAIPLLLDLYSSSIKLVAVLKRSSIAKDLKATCQSYYEQVENLREFIYDLENFRTDDFGLDEILQEINTL